MVRLMALRRQDGARAFRVALSAGRGCGALCTPDTAHRISISVLILVDLVLWPAREYLLLAPTRHVFEGLAVDKIEECLFVGPFTGDQIRGIVAHVFPKC